jgi:glycosyltransferase involved in cell wall biosynthesis
MKILMLGWELPPVNSGGLGVVCYQLCRHLADAGVAIDFVMPYALPHDVGVDFMTVHSASPVIASTQGTFGPYANWHAELAREQQQYLQTVEQLVAHNQYDAIHAHDWLTYSAGLRAKELSGRPLIAHVHSTEFDRCGQTTGNPLVHEIEYNGLLMADKIVAVSNITKQLLVDRYHLSPNKVDVMYNAGDPQLLQAQSGDNLYVYLTRMKQHGYKVVVSLGRLTIQKGLYYLLQAAKQALQVNPKLLFLVVGDGEQRDELIALSAQLGIAQNVIFTGFLRGKAWRDAYTIADMFVMTSVSEPFGLTALEAAGVGTAVLLTKQSGVSEVLHSTMRFDFWDTAKLADYIINIGEQDALRTTLAKNARLEVAAMTWQDTAARLNQLYQNIAGALV